MTVKRLSIDIFVLHIPKKMYNASKKGKTSNGYDNVFIL